MISPYSKRHNYGEIVYSRDGIKSYMLPVIRISSEKYLVGSIDGFSLVLLIIKTYHIVPMKPIYIVRNTKISCRILLLFGFFLTIKH